MTPVTTLAAYCRHTLCCAAGVLVLLGAPGPAGAQTTGGADAAEQQKPTEAAEERAAPGDDDVAVEDGDAVLKEDGADARGDDAGEGDDAGMAVKQGSASDRAENAVAKEAAAGDEDEGAAAENDIAENRSHAPADEHVGAAVKDGEAAAADDNEAVDDDTEVIEVTGRSQAGSAQFVDKDYLERYEHDDVLKVLAAVPGVYIRQEDGYGLRPNIGMRGSGSERSSKIALMTDDILFAPAPYSAPAAYYFPILTKMVGMEVIKGPTGIRNGPNTVGGSINLLLRPIPDKREIGLDIAGGTDLYGKWHMYYGESTEHFGWLVEGVKLRCDGFKVLDNGGPTGFDKNDATVRFRIKNSASAAVSHQLEGLFGYGTEISHETYTGITTDDFQKTPYRRYAATQLDLLQWQHMQARLTYRLSTNQFDVDAVAYRHMFHRDWDKLNRFGIADEDYSLSVIMLNPRGGNISLYQVLTGDEDSNSMSQRLMLGGNDRRFVSQGVQVKISTQRHWFGWNHNMELGTRLHYDDADRFHTEEPYRMSSGTMVRADGPTEILLDAFDSTLAWASYYQHEAQYGAWTVTLGARGELIDTKHTGDQWDIVDVQLPEVTNNYFVFIPGGGVVYRPIRELEILAGVHRGFVPNSPTQGGTVPPEMSVNYEAGFRFNSNRVSVEAIGFFSDFSNLIGTCSFATGCAADRVGLEFSGGSVHSYGAEVEASVEIPVVGTLIVPLRAAYTLQQSIFQESFVSSNPQWGIVEPGYHLPYIPEHQVYASIGLRGENWGVEGYGHYTSEMRDIASIGNDLGAPTDATRVFNGAAHYRVEGWGQLYTSVENIVNEPYIVSRRPMGARPGVPRRIVLGYKNEF